jgi:eukaryotic-like serine/threonine-protein kinase
MSLTSGTRIGSYQILGVLGAGGMGEVYRARDTRLDRDVAVKILPESFAHDPDRLMRFEREAKTLASLNHPNIAQIYGLEKTSGVFSVRDEGGPAEKTPDVSSSALVMELVEGRTLDEMLAAPLGVTESLDIARQIASALEAAHDAGVVHRDLKPANVKIRDDGTVKVLDFGLAKGVQGDGSGSRQQEPSATAMTSPAMTAMGIILGTAGYMSPEQARGRQVDKRADIWAFGVVLFEMLSGRRLFAGETVSDTLAAVLTREPDLGSLPGDLPGYVRDLLRRCLDRDPKTRLRDIGEARIALERGPAAETAPVKVQVAERPKMTSLLAVGGALAILAAAGGWWAGHRGPPAEAPWDHFTQLTDQAGAETWPVISPDGASIAYASRERGSWDIYLQRIGGRNPVLVAGDPNRDETAPAFSPDGSTIAFHESDADGGVFIAGATGESARRLTDFGFNPSWSPDGTQIVFSTEEVVDPHGRGGTAELWVVASGGGTPTKIYDGDAVQPAWSPSGQRIAFWSADGGQRDLATIPAAGGAAVKVMEDAPLDWSPAWAPDGATLYFSSDRGGTMNLWRIAIDEASGRALGAPQPVTGGVSAAIDEPGLSRDGSRLVFRADLSLTVPLVVPFDAAAERIGTPMPIIRRNGSLGVSSLSPDGRWLLYTNQGERQEDLFISRADGSELRRLTDDLFRDRAPVWSPDGKEIAFYSNRTGTYQIWAIKPDGSGLRQVSAWNTDLAYPLYSPTGDRMIASEFSGHAFFFDPSKAAAEQQPKPIATELSKGAAAELLAWSPDGRRAAGTIALANGNPVGVAVYDVATDQTTKLSDDLDAYGLAWLSDSRRLLIVDGSGRLWIMDVDSKRRRRIEVPPPYRLGGLLPSPDGRTLFGSGRLAESDVWMVERSPKDR